MPGPKLAILIVFAVAYAVATSPSIRQLDRASDFRDASATKVSSLKGLQTSSRARDSEQMFRASRGAEAKRDRKLDRILERMKSLETKLDAMATGIRDLQEGEAAGPCPPAGDGDDAATGARSCPSPQWQLFQDSCYRVFIREFGDHEASSKFCQGEEAHLVAVESEDENDFLAEEYGGNTMTWLDLSKSFYGAWVWDYSQKPAVYTNWLRIGGTSFEDDDDFRCAVWRNRTWIPFSCDMESRRTRLPGIPAICERAAL